MNKTTGIWAVLMGMMLLQGCDRSDGMLDDDKDMRPLVPDRPTPIDPNIPKPPNDAQVMTTDADQIFDVAGEPVLLRGINLQYDVNPSASIEGIAAIRSVGSNVVRLHLNKDTKADQLENALDQVLAQDLIAVLVFTGPEIACTSYKPAIDAAVSNRWLKTWMPVLSQARFQSHIMINIANAWGPVDVFSSAASQSYGNYIATYKEYIRRFRDMGFKVPLVIDAPGCGEDHHAFMGGRAQELLAADSQSNLVLSLHAFSTSWNSERKIRENTGDLQRLQIPFIIGSFGGSGAPGSSPVDHDELMYMATGNQALTLSLPWTGPEDHVSMTYPLGEEKDIIGLGATFEAFIPQTYIDAGGRLSMQLVFENANGEYALTSPSLASSRFRNRWNRYTFAVSTEEDLAESSEGFDPTRVTRVGIRVSANGKAASVAGDILIDQFTISGVADPILFSRFDTNIAGWERPWGATASEGNALTWSDGALAILPDWGGTEFRIPVRTTAIAATQPPLDLEESFTVSFRVFVPAEYATETSLSLQPFLQDGVDWVFTGIDFINFKSPEFTFDQWNTVNVSVPDLQNHILSDGYTGNDAFDVTVRPNALGIEIANVFTAKSLPILIDDVRVESSNVSSSFERVTAYENGLANWKRGWGAGEGDNTAVTYSDGVLSILAPWSASAPNIAVNDDTLGSLPTPIDAASPFVVSFEVFIPDEYASEANMALQPFALDASSSAAFGGLAYINVAASIPLGEWHPMEIGIVDIISDGNNINPAEFSVDGPLNGIGLEVAGVSSAKTEPVQIRNFKVETLVEVDATVLSLNFESDAEVTDFAFVDRPVLSDTTWLASFDDTVKTASAGVNPFGWIAWTWKGTDEESSQWSISLKDGFSAPGDPESGVDLTDRGEDVVNGVYGIFMSTQPAEPAE